MYAAIWLSVFYLIPGLPITANRLGADQTDNARSDECLKSLYHIFPEDTSHLLPTLRCPGVHGHFFIEMDAHDDRDEVAWTVATNL